MWNVDISYIGYQDIGGYIYLRFKPIEPRLSEFNKSTDAATTNDIENVERSEQTKGKIFYDDELDLVHYLSVALDSMLVLALQ